MPTPPPATIPLPRPFAPRFSKRVWLPVRVLLAGAILAPAHRTVTAALRVVGLGHSPHFQRDHRALNRASWSALAASRVLQCLSAARRSGNGATKRFAGQRQSCSASFPW